MLNNCYVSPIFVGPDRMTRIEYFKLDLIIEISLQWNSSYCSQKNGGSNVLTPRPAPCDHSVLDWRGSIRVMPRHPARVGRSIETWEIVRRRSALARSPRYLAGSKPRPSEHAAAAVHAVSSRLHPRRLSVRRRRPHSLQPHLLSRHARLIPPPRPHHCRRRRLRAWLHIHTAASPIASLCSTVSSQFNQPISSRLSPPSFSFSLSLPQG